MIRKTEDGSLTLYSEVVGETYHSLFGALQESEHIFIKAGLDYFCANSCTKKVRILEIGFGTGLNTLLTYRYSLVNQVEIEYHTIELYPIEEELYAKLGYSNSVEEEQFFQLIHEAEFCGNKPNVVADNFTIYKYHSDIAHQVVQMAQCESYKFDLIYFDAFSPDSQPELWSQEVFNSIAKIADNGAVITTYCAKGDVRRAMIVAGFVVSKLPGPPGKRHMLRGKIGDFNGLTNSSILR